MRPHHLFAVGGLLLIMAGLAFVAQAQEETPAPSPPPITDPVGEAPHFLTGYYEAWLTSPHADTEAMAFNDWNADGAVPERCAKCHSTPGYLDYLGADGSDFGVVDAAAPIGSVVNCDACHNPAASGLQAVEFPSGAVGTGLEDSGRCMVCHQGRASTVQVMAAFEDMGEFAENQNTVDPELRFVNVHYYAAAASLFGSEALGGFQYPNMRYQPRFDHVESYDTCAECHNPHTTEVRVEECQSCHEDVDTVEDLIDVRMQGSLRDYDGDEDIDEGIAGEIETLQELLLQAVQQYALEVAGTAIGYNEHAHPYWFIDVDESGEIEEAEAVGDNAYNAFSPLLLTAAYNYQFSLKDPGNYAHNAKYHIELLVDSITMLNAQVAEPEVDTAFLVRDDAGHFDATAEAFRHWDADGAVEADCVKCHNAAGLPLFLAEEGRTISLPPTDSLACTTCHDQLPDFTLYEVEDVQFPSGAVLSFGPGEPTNLCIECHQGRESTVSVNRAIERAGVGDDEVSPDISFRNPHYFAAGATLFGSEAMGAYQYGDKEYVGRFPHDESMNTCIDCHQPHALEVQVEYCGDCHDDVETLEDVHLIRMEGEDEELIDFDGDGDAEEPIRDEIQSFMDALFTGIQAYAADTIGTPIAYSPAAYPYWFIDSNANGALDPDEANNGNRYATWTPALLRGAYNFQYVSKDPGAFAHNADYILQVLYDSIEDMGGVTAVETFVRPPITANDVTD